jgi:hypothetical protein
MSREAAMEKSIKKTQVQTQKTMQIQKRPFRHKERSDYGEI